MFESGFAARSEGVALPRRNSALTNGALPLLISHGLWLSLH